jgi:thiol-disulfide isomerase/thioredoxin
MIRSFKLFLVFIVLTALGTTIVHSQGVNNIRTADLEKILKNQDNTLHVVNFWATWCAPCVRELPYFEKLSKVYDSKKVRFILVSLDFPSEVEKKLKPFLEKNRISLDVALMQDLDYDKWIAKVDPEWYGNLPATLVFNNPKKIKVFHPGEVDEAGLRKLIDENLK